MHSPGRKTWRSRFLFAAGVLGAAAPAFAYRPFDSTDADVAAAGETELEVGALGMLRQGETKYWTAPALVANFGVSDEREVVIEGQYQRPRNAPDVSTSVSNTGLFVKRVLRRGVLQDEAGPSVAAEYGMLLPEIHGQNSAGLSGTLIVSQRWAHATVHLNAGVELNRDHRAEGFLGAIVEGPTTWTLRPAAEWLFDQASRGPRINSRLFGMIWRARPDMTVDFGLRSASGAERTRELRAGFTWRY